MRESVREREREQLKHTNVVELKREFYSKGDKVHAPEAVCVRERECVCECVRERERESERQSEREKERVREREVLTPTQKKIDNQLLNNSLQAL